MIDSFKHQGLRKQLIEDIRKKGIRDERLLAAMLKIPRHFFMDNVFVEFAYQDKAFPISSGQTISQPYTVAFQTQLMHVQRGDKILEIGTGSGYQTAVLCEMGAKVYSLERHKPLHDHAQKVLTHLNYTAKLYFGDGFKGLPAFSPFDKILVTCAAPLIPQQLISQLKIGGIMIIPVGEGEVQVMKSITRKNENEVDIIDYDKFRFVPMLENKVL
jgi:protein-L-isoaspartate(D-aspartate) O-methyltransferase